VTVTANTAVSSVVFSPTSSSATLSVDSGFVLTVTSTVILNSSTSTDANATIMGEGGMTAASVTSGLSTTVPDSTHTTKLIFAIATSTISGTARGVSTGSGGFTNTGEIDLQSGSMTVGTLTFTPNTGPAPIFSLATGAQTGTLTIMGSGTPVGSGGTFTANGTGATVNYNSQSGTTNINATTYFNLTTGMTANASVTAFVLAGNTTVENRLTVGASSGSTHSFSASTFTLTLSGSGIPFVKNSSGSFATTASTVNYTGTSSTTIATVTYATLNLGAVGIGAARTYSMVGSVTVSGVLTLNSPSTGVNTFDISSQTLSLTGSGTPLVLNGNTFTITSSTVNYQGTSATAITATTYHNLGVGFVSNAINTTYTLAGDMSVNGTLNVGATTGAGIHTFNASTYTISIVGSGTPFRVNASGAFFANESTVNYVGTSITAILNTAYYSLGIGTTANATNVSYTIPASASITVTSTLTIGAASGAGVHTLVAGTGTITLSQSGTPFVINSFGVFTAQTSHVKYIGTSDTTIASTTYNNLTLGATSTGAARTYTSLSSFTVGSLLTVLAPSTGVNTLDISNVILTLSGSGTPLVLNGNTLMTTGSTVNFTGTSATTIPVADYAHLGAGTTVNTSNVTYSLANDMTVSGVFTVGAAGGTGIHTVFASTTILTLTGAGTPFVVNSAGVFSASLGTVVFSQSSAQTILDTVTTTFNNLTINNAGGVYLSHDTSVSTTLTLLSGNIVTGAGNTFEMTSDNSIARTSGHIVGRLRMHVATGAVSKTFVIGTGSDYSPIDLSFGEVTVAGMLIASTTASDHPDVENSGINSSKSVNRYVSFENESVIFDTYDAVFHFLASDVDAGANTSNFVVKKLSLGVWSSPTVGTKTATSIQVTGLISFSDFIIGEVDVVEDEQGTSSGGGGVGAGLAPQGMIRSDGIRIPLDFMINDGSGVTSNPLLQLSYMVDLFTVRGYSVSLDSSFRDPLSTSYVPIRTFLLPEISGLYTVYVRFISETGQISPIVSHQVFYVPTGTLIAVPPVSVPPEVKLCYVSQFTKDLKYGSQSAEVKLLQVFLNAHGFTVAKFGPGSKGNETTFFGPATLAAVRAFQNSYAFFQSGVFAGETRQFAQSLVPKITCPVSQKFPRDLRYGSRGTDVKSLQVFLNVHGFTLAKTGAGSRGQETTFFGTATRAALKTFQKTYLLIQTGILSGMTRLRINGM